MNGSMRVACKVTGPSTPAISTEELFAHCSDCPTPGFCSYSKECVYPKMERVVGFYEINSFPGCPQIAVSNHAFILPGEHKKGYGTKFHGQRLKEMKELGFDYVLCTVATQNEFQKKILRGFAWKWLSSFSNKETGSVVELWGKELNE